MNTPGSSMASEISKALPYNRSRETHIIGHSNICSSVAIRKFNWWRVKGDITAIWTAWHADYFSTYLHLFQEFQNNWQPPRNWVWAQTQSSRDDSWEKRVRSISLLGSTALINGKSYLLIRFLPVPMKGVLPLFGWSYYKNSKVSVHVSHQFF